MGIFLRKKEGEQPASLVYRFLKKVQQSGILREAKERRFSDRRQNKRKRRLSAIYRSQKTAEILRARKLGLL